MAQSFTFLCAPALLAVLLSGCGAGAPAAGPATATAAQSSCADAAAYRPVNRAEQWVAYSSPALTVTGDLIFASALAQFQHFRPAGLRFQGNQQVGPLASALMEGSCASVFELVVDPASQAGEGRLCAGQDAGFLAARLSSDGEKLHVTVFPAGVDPAAGADPCQAYSYVRLEMNGGGGSEEGLENAAEISAEILR